MLSQADLAADGWRQHEWRTAAARYCVGAAQPRARGSMRTTGGARDRGGGSGGSNQVARIADVIAVHRAGPSHIARAGGNGKRLVPDLQGPVARLGAVGAAGRLADRGYSGGRAGRRVGTIGGCRGALARGLEAGGGEEERDVHTRGTQ